VQPGGARENVTMHASANTARAAAAPRAILALLATHFATLAMLLAGPGAALAQPAAYPQRPVRFIVPYPPGGGADTLARIIIRGVSGRWNHPIVVDNRPGADATIGVHLTAQAPADGHTLVLVITSHAVHPSLRKLPYDLGRDLAPVSNVLEGPAVLVVNPGLKATSVKELIALAKARAGQLNFGAPGIGGPGHLSGIMFNQQAGVQTTHIPYKGASAVVTALVGGEVDFMFATVLSGMPHVKSGRLRALAVTSAARSPSAPELPTMIESGLPKFESVTWYGVLTRGGTPAPVLEAIHADIMAAVRTPELGAQLTSQGVQIVGMGPKPFAAYVQSEIAKWAAVIRQADPKDLQAQ
jgi:tripartite-type tricarboxylate transporter receptor subunit TctC